MNARLSATVAAALLAGLAAGAGCVPNDASVRIAAMCFPPAPNEDGSCSYPATCDSILLGDLEVNVTVNATTGLVWPVQIDNQLPPNDDASAGRLDTHTAWIERYKIEYSSPVLSIADTEVSISSHPVPPAGSSVVIIPVFPVSVTTLLSTAAFTGFAPVTAKVRAVGRLGDGSGFETGPFQVVVTACKTCTPPGNGCPAATPTLVGICPQFGQTGIPLCQ